MEVAVAAFLFAERNVEIDHWKRARKKAKNAGWNIRLGLCATKIIIHHLQLPPSNLNI